MKVGDRVTVSLDLLARYRVVGIDAERYAGVGTVTEIDVGEAYGTWPTVRFENGRELTTHVDNLTAT